MHVGLSTAASAATATTIRLLAVFIVCPSAQTSWLVRKLARKRTGKSSRYQLEWSGEEFKERERELPERFRLFANSISCFSLHGTLVSSVKLRRLNRCIGAPQHEGIRLKNDSANFTSSSRERPTTRPMTHADKLVESHQWWCLPILAAEVLRYC